MHETTGIERDLQAVVDVTIRYCWALDEREWHALKSVFTPDATALLASRDELEGVDAIIDRVTLALDHLDASQHRVSNHQVAITGDTATSRCYMQAQHVREVEGSNNFIVAGSYHDRLVRTDDGWRIEHRELKSVWTSGNPLVVTPDT
jgi:hypothetical protein